MERRTRLWLAVLGVTVVGLAARLVALGGRPFHWEEARVGYWALRFVDTGVYDYRPVAGGPLVYLLDRWTFRLLGVSDATARLPVALLTGLGPLVALLFRGTLSDGETVALAGLLAFDPLVLYYSRFLRGDAIAALLGLAVLGTVVRYADSDDGRWITVGAALFAVALAASGFALAYPVVWLTAAIVTLDEARIRGSPDAALRTLSAGRDRLAAAVRPIARAVVVFLVVSFFLFAPRSAGAAPGIAAVTTWPAVFDAAIVTSVERFVGYRVVYRLQPTTPGRHPLVPYLVGVARPLVAVSGATVVAGAVGFLTERYAADSRRLVAFAGYAVAVGVFVAAITAWTPDPWVAVHLVPLAAIPAAVGVGRLWGLLRRHVRGTEYGRVALAAALVASAGAVAAVPVAGVYEPHDRGSAHAQYAQPTTDIESRLPAMAAAMAAAEGPDVVYVGSRFDTGREYPRPPVAPADRDAWGARFPLPWYVERLDAGVTSVPAAGDLPSDPGIVVTTPARADAVGTQLGSEYERTRFELAAFGRPVVVFLHGS